LGSRWAAEALVVAGGVEDEVVRAACLDTGEQLRAPITRTLVYGLNDPAPSRPSRAAAS
jgi:hypothetical protein